jgi:hypothetical protein
MYNRPMCGRSAGTYRDLGDLKQRDLRNQNLGDLKKGPKGGLSPTPQTKKKGYLVSLLLFLLKEGKPAKITAVVACIRQN